MEDNAVHTVPLSAMLFTLLHSRALSIGFFHKRVLRVVVLCSEMQKTLLSHCLSARAPNVPILNSLCLARKGNLLAM